VLLPLRPIDLEEQIAEAEGVPGAKNPRDRDGDGRDDETGEVISDDATDSAGDEEGDEDAGEMTVAQCLAVAPQLAPLLEDLGDPSLVASIKSLRLSAVPPPYSAMIPAACRQ
jgi:3-methyladenine DNA glycosylase/8-oxoguanine DNA glycosylase